MIVVTGAAGFIGSQLIKRLNADGFYAIAAVDRFNDHLRHRNLDGLKVAERIERDWFYDWFDRNRQEVEFVFHLGARTDTAEFDTELLAQLNTTFTQQVWKQCILYQVPLVYASSAATYGLGELGYDDADDKLCHQLKPLNPYGVSKNEFDKWAVEQAEKPWFWVGLKFFNVYGPGEYFKNRMASVVWHAYHQIKKTGGMKLFRSHNPQFKDGEQQRDFIHVHDVVEVMYWLLHHREPKSSGIYNLGTGQARTFLDLTRATFKAMGVPENISFIDTPVDIRDKYQYFTEAKMERLKGIGYDTPFMSLEEGVAQYVQHLESNNQ